MGRRMTTRTASDTADPQIDSRDDLLPLCIKGEKPKSAWRIGTEHEKFVYRRSDHRAPSYDEPGGIRDLLHALACCGQWPPVIEGVNAIALPGPAGTVSPVPPRRLLLPSSKLAPPLLPRFVALRILASS